MSYKYIYGSGAGTFGVDDVYGGGSDRTDEKRNLIGPSDLDSCIGNGNPKNGNKTISRFKKVKEQLLGKSDRPSTTAPAAGGGGGGFGGCFCFRPRQNRAARPRRPKSFTIQSLKCLIEKEKTELFARKFNATLDKRTSSSYV